MQTTDIILEVIYRYPNKEILSFQNKIYDTIATIESEKLHYIISGDINIDTLGKKNKKTIDYCNTLTSIGCKMETTNPTRFANNCSPSLLGLIYTNISKKYTLCGISSFEISDHLPTFFCVRQGKCHIKKEKQFIRCMKKFALEEFLSDLEHKLSRIDFESKSTCVNDNVNNLITVFKDVLNLPRPIYTK